MGICHNVENFNVSGLDTTISLENCRRTFSVTCESSGLILPKVWPMCIPATHCVGHIQAKNKIETTSNRTQKKVQLDCLALKSCFTHQCRGGTLPFSPLCLTLASGWDVVIVIVIVIVILIVIDRHWYLHSTF